MNDQGRHKEVYQRSRDSSPRQLICRSSSLWTSAKKHRHTNPGGVLGVRTTQGQSKDSSSEGEMNLKMEQLARRPLKMCTSAGPTFRVYSHATDPHRNALSVNGVHHDSPTPPPGPPQVLKEVASECCSVSHPVKRELVVENGATLTPVKKRLKLSLNKERRSHTPSRSGCSSRSSSPCSSLQYASCSSTPPLTPPFSPPNIKTESPKLTEETPLPRRRHGSSTPLMVKSSLTSMIVESSEDEPLEVILIEGEVPFSSASNPETSQQAQVPSPRDATPPLDASPPRDATPTLDEECGDSPQEVERFILIEDEEMPKYHDISQWGDGRLVYGCDLTNCKPFDKFSSGHLENYSELVSKEGDLDNYLHTAERLVNQGCFFPIIKLDEVFRVMWKCGSEHAVKKMHSILQQDISLRTNTSMKGSHFCHKMKKCLEALISGGNVLVASVQLSYLLSFLVKNLDATKHEPRSSLVEQLLSSKRNTNAILDAIFSLQERPAADGVTSVAALSPVDCLLGMICLPLLTCDPSTRLNLRTELAREFAMRLDTLPSHSSRYELINAIPSNYLKEKVIDFILERYFVLPYDSSAVAQAFSDNSVSFAKITSLHLHRLPRHPDGSSQSLSFFLQMLISLIQSHLLSMTAGQPLVSLLPSTPPLPSHFLVNSGGLLLDDAQLKEALLDMHHGVCQLSNRLTQDEDYVCEVTEPATWFRLQLLSLITSVA